MLAFEGAKKEKVSFIVYDSSVSGKKEICKYGMDTSLSVRDGVHIYSHIVTNHPRETIYSEHMPLSSLPENNVYALTLDYYTYYLQHVIHIQVLQSLQRSRITRRKKGIMSSDTPACIPTLRGRREVRNLPVLLQTGQTLQLQQSGRVLSGCGSHA